MTRHQEDQEFEAEVELLRSCHDAYANARARLKAAGTRAATAEVIRRAAIREMGQTLAEYRTELATLQDGTGGRGGDWHIDMEDAADLTGVTRRTLSTAVGAAETETPTSRDYRTWSDRALAADCLAYGRASHEDPVRELWLRYPDLAGLGAAVKTLQEAEFKQWSSENPSWFTMTADDLGSEPSAALLLLSSLYQQRLEAIAAGKATVL
ncbi:hypothetical protein ACFWXO_16425 [Kitasatospora sp. NPDC059088]|uniref:hypothetical protein n=1 Tax=Kitasatospora sp. NPDC059088 TaxID=3346722 RepID=UPI0036882C7B